MKTLIIQPKALKQLRRIPERSVIIDKCEELKQFPLCANVKSLIINTLIASVWGVIGYFSS
ncbi:type II toxin-antitoxin system RelE family toxin [Avibacterium paragallinarum]|uniref:Uncharacterized protein n=1 Tax=Avibacterium paragallinarum TaxID=728 RepID=A0A377IUK4_AVIPA|nr:hypothetical protein [Avibacterium paragallinarum]CDG00357.1 Putative uncharacterized protein HIB_15990 [Avibacterium paragallinarum JF4211]STO91944.1 Uncharacterised protein [Avibacterium paragallinarum]